jgi:hypothetical protein
MCDVFFCVRRRDSSKVSAPAGADYWSNYPLSLSSGAALAVTHTKTFFCLLACDTCEIKIDARARRYATHIRTQELRMKVVEIMASQ